MWRKDIKSWLAKYEHAVLTLRKVNFQPNISRICSTEIHRQSFRPDSNRIGLAKMCYLRILHSHSLKTYAESSMNTLTVCSRSMHLNP